MIHILQCLLSAARRPRVALLGIREFRLSCTTHFEWPQMDNYDAGRELAHIFTFRHWDGCR